MNRSSPTAFISSTPLGSPRSVKSKANSLRLQERSREVLVDSSNLSNEIKSRTNSSLLRDLVESIETRNFPLAMQILNQLRQFDTTYEAISECQNLKISLAAAEKTTAKIIHDNSKLQKIIEEKDIEIDKKSGCIDELQTSLKLEQSKNAKLSEKLRQKESENVQILKTYENDQRIHRNTASKLDREIISLKVKINSQQKRISQLECELNSASGLKVDLEKRLIDEKIEKKTQKCRIEELKIQNKDYVTKMAEISNKIGEERAREKQREIGNLLLERIDTMLSRSRDPSSPNHSKIEKQLEKRKTAVTKLIDNNGKL